ncbi:MAG: shikimate dehydrogenase [Gemmatimonadetes bacterium]|nr:shikimate dehydrogenase [Gemmatimonadota bacterium]
MRVRATSRVLAVIGDPVAHSLSPAMHNAAIAALGFDAVYVALHATGATFEVVARGVLAAGGALNVTVPFKRQAAELVAAPSEAVRRTGACNTLWGDGVRPDGDNTDIAGIREASRVLLSGRRVERAVVIGTGGSARAAAVAVADEWPGATVLIVSRDAERAQAFVAWAEKASVGCRVGVGDGGPAELMVNTTPLGLRPEDPLPLEGHALERLAPAGVLDLVYAKGQTPLVRAAQALGARAADGRGVLVAQGASAFTRFFGVPAPTEIMRAAVEDALRA